MKGAVKIIKGHILYTPEPNAFTIIEHGYIIVEGLHVVYCGDAIPNEYLDYPITDYGDKLIIPGFVDTHVHGPQYANRGLGMDMELLPWLETYTFPEEAKFKDPQYARKVYTAFINDLKRNGTTRAVIFSTIHVGGTIELMRAVEHSGISAYVGKVNMDRNSPEYLTEELEQSITDTIRCILESTRCSPAVNYIITPRFVPTCTSKLMKELAKLAKKYNLPVQSHLSENRGEIEWVRSLHPESENYAAVYEEHRLIGKQPAIMAHCVHVTDDEIQILVRTDTMVAHCPYSNNNLSSGIAPIRKLLESGVKVGLGSDISGGHSVSMAKVLTEAIQLSKMRWAEVDANYKSLTLSEAFYLATRGGGTFFGKVGSFEPGFEFDAIVIDDTDLCDDNERTLVERLERWLYIGDDRQVTDIYCRGKLLA